MTYLSLSRLTCIICISLLTAGLVSCKGSGSKTPSTDTATAHTVQTTDPAVDSALSDSTWPDGTRVFHTASTKIRAVKGDQPGDRVYELDGEAFLIIKDADKKPFIIRTRQLIITIQSPYARLHIDAFASSPGEQADLLEGQLRVTKSYHSSTDNEPETLKSGDMVMINRDIDLMEKETLDLAERKTVEKRFPKMTGEAPHN